MIENAKLELELDTGELDLPGHLVSSLSDYLSQRYGVVLQVEDRPEPDTRFRYVDWLQWVKDYGEIVAAIVTTITLAAYVLKYRRKPNVGDVAEEVQPFWDKEEEGRRLPPRTTKIEVVEEINSDAQGDFLVESGDASYRIVLTRRGSQCRRITVLREH